MVDAVGTALSVANVVISALQGVRVNRSACACLGARWERISSAIDKLQNENEANSGDLPGTHLRALNATTDLGRETLVFIEAFTSAWYLRKVVSYQEHRQKFQDLGSRLDGLLVELQLGIAVDTRTFLSELERKYDDDAEQHSRELAELRRSVESGQAATNRKLDGVRTAVKKLGDLQRLRSTASRRQNESMIEMQRDLLDELKALRRIVSRSRSRSVSRGRSLGGDTRQERDADASEGVSTYGSTPMMQTNWRVSFYLFFQLPTMCKHAGWLARSLCYTRARSLPPPYLLHCML